MDSKKTVVSLPVDEIFCGDNVEVMAGLPDESIPLTVTSPPYDNLRSYNGYSWDFEALAAQLWRVTKPGGVVVWVVGDATVSGSETGTSFRQALYFMDLGFNLHDTMIYKVAGVGAKGSHASYWQAFEYMFVLSKETPKSINLIRDKRNRYAGKNQGTSGEKTNSIGMRLHGNGYQTQKVGIRENVWVYPAGNSNGGDLTDHPAPFPEQLAHDHIISWSNPGDLVLDPFMGSGTTAKMCVLTDRHFIGIDISEDYCNLARRRVAAVKQQPKLFSWDLQPVVNGR
jgi:DNA modification methylase